MGCDCTYHHWWRTGGCISMFGATRFNYFSNGNNTHRELFCRRNDVIAYTITIWLHLCLYFRPIMPLAAVSKNTDKPNCYGIYRIINKHHRADSAYKQFPKPLYFFWNKLKAKLKREICLKWLLAAIFYMQIPNDNALTNYKNDTVSSFTSSLYKTFAFETNTYNKSAQEWIKSNMSPLIPAFRSLYI